VSRFTSFRVPRSRLVLALGALTLATVSPGFADPLATGYVWGASGPGADSHSASASGAGSSTISAQAGGLFSHVDAGGTSGSTTADVNITSKAQSVTGYAAAASSSSSSGGAPFWTAVGTMNWSGNASATTCLDASAKANGLALLAYSGDLVLVGAGVVAVEAGSSGTSVEWLVSTSPSVKQKVKRQPGAGSDSCAGGAATSNSGTGWFVSVGVFAYAEGRLTLDTNAFGFGQASADMGVTNRGSITVCFMVPVPQTSTGQGTTTNPGGVPGWRVARLRFDSDGTCQTVGQSEPIAMSETVPDDDEIAPPTPLEGVDDEGNVWSYEQTGQ
jgi:hypothetical protein